MFNSTSYYFSKSWAISAHVNTAPKLSWLERFEYSRSLSCHCNWQFCLTKVNKVTGQSIQNKLILHSASHPTKMVLRTSAWWLFFASVTIRPRLVSLRPQQRDTLTDGQMKCAAKEPSAANTAMWNWHGLMTLSLSCRRKKSFNS